MSIFNSHTLSLHKRGNSHTYPAGLAQLPTGNCFAAHDLEEEQGRRGSVDAVRAVARGYCIYRGHERDHQAVSCGKREFRRRGRQDASGMVQVNADTVGALGQAIH